MTREYIYDIEHVEKFFNSKTNDKIFGFKAKQWSLKITRISTGSYHYDIVVGREVVGHIMCGTDTPYPPYIPDEFTIELFPTEDGREIEHEPCTRTPYKFREAVRSFYECTSIIDQQLNPRHWANDPEPDL